jgi:hypothetical protein
MARAPSSISQPCEPPCPFHVRFSRGQKAKARQSPARPGGNGNSAHSRANVLAQQVRRAVPLRHHLHAGRNRTSSTARVACCASLQQRLVQELGRAAAGGRACRRAKQCRSTTLRSCISNSPAATRMGWRGSTCWRAELHRLHAQQDPEYCEHPTVCCNPLHSRCRAVPLQWAVSASCGHTGESAPRKAPAQYNAAPSRRSDAAALA